MGKQPASRLFNWNDAVEMIAAEGWSAGMLVKPCGLRGDQMTAQLADCRDDALARGHLFVARHDAPGPLPSGSITTSNLAVVVPWAVLVRRVDTRGREKHDPVFLGPRGTYVFEAPEDDVVRQVGEVLVVGPETENHAGEPNCGAILLAPNAPWS